jgi:hypothetical protein
LSQQSDKKPISWTITNEANITTEVRVEGEEIKYFDKDGKSIAAPEAGAQGTAAQQAVEQLMTTETVVKKKIGIIEEASEETPEIPSAEEQAEEIEADVNLASEIITGAIT